MRGEHRYIVPVALRATVIHLAHETQGVVRTKQRLRDLYWWPQMDKMVQSVISSCTTCQMNDKSAKTAPAALQPIELPNRPWEKVALDIVVSQPLHESITGLISGTVVKFVLINTVMTWTAAQKYCREYHSDLASVRNMTENQKIQQLVPARDQVWIGLYRDAWKWSDGRNFSLSYWNSIEPNNAQHGENCVSAAFNYAGKWEDWTCDLKRSINVLFS
uniref:C-type lectin domain-containing protein n=1 Tax=Fundulus heteroclitus TaxID=8078 RepID=A0A3Q2QRP3_FUNHE